MMLTLERPPDLPNKRSEIDARLDQLAADLGISVDELKSDTLAILIYSLILHDFVSIPRENAKQHWTDFVVQIANATVEFETKSILTKTITTVDAFEQPVDKAKQTKHSSAKFRSGADALAFWQSTDTLTNSHAFKEFHSGRAVNPSEYAERLRKGSEQRHHDIFSDEASG